MPEELPNPYAAANSDSQGPLLSGPLIGEVCESCARIWVQARDDAELTLCVFDSSSSQEFVKTPSQSDFFCVVFTVTGLQTGGRYEYALRSRHGETARYRLNAALSETATAAHVAFGSCFSDYWNAQPIFAAIARENPAAFILLGDNCYYAQADWQNEQTMLLAQLRNRNQADFRKLVRETSTLAIYDDHDFGPNDADGNFFGREAALATFRRVFAQSSYGLPEVPGIFSSVRIGPIEIFLTDGRYHRNVLGKTVLGRAQFDWLLSALSRSQAQVKLFASGTTVLAQHPFYHDWECWRRTAPDELDELLLTIEQKDISGVLFISGDLHMGQVRHIAGRTLGAKRGPDYWELTSSPLAIDPYNEHVIWPEAALVAQIPDRHNYGVIEIDLERKDAEILLLLKDSNGQNLYRKPVALASLCVR